MSHSLKLYTSLILSLSCFSVHADITPSASFTVDSSNVVSGGIKRAHALRGLLDVGVEAEVPFIEGGTVFVQALMQQGDHGSVYSGDIQGYSNIDSHDFESIFEACYGQSLFNDRFNIKLGWMDGNSDFAATEHGAEFINSSMGFSPTIYAMPTYPDTVLATSMALVLGENHSFQIGLFDGKGNDKFEQTFAITQYVYHVNQTHLVLGYWDHSESADTQGWYASIDHHVTNHVAIYSQLGLADKAVAEIDQHLGFGVVKYAPLNRAHDSLGLAVTQASVVAQKTNETTIEAFYLLALDQHFFIKPDLQYIDQPSGDRQIKNAWVFTLRATAQY